MIWDYQVNYHYKFDIFQIRIPDSQSSKTQFGLISEDLQKQLRDILQSDADKDDSKVFKQAKDHFKACMDLENLEKIGYDPLKNALKVFGGWPVLEDKWDESQFDWWVLEQFSQNKFM